MDTHEGAATVREALRFSAYLRQPFEVPIEEKNEYVEEIIELLELQDITNALISSLSVEGWFHLSAIPHMCNVFSHQLANALPLVLSWRRSLSSYCTCFA